ncbi:MAG: histidine kinase, partial [Lachnospiraceae bacterium]|nr:histidine kinase [Lachnospiraceae bacterium]
MSVMQDTIVAYHIAVEICMGVFCIICLFMSTAMRYYDRIRSNYLVVFLSIAAVLGASEGFALAYRGDTSNAGFYIVRISNFLVFFLTYAITGVGVFYLKHLIISRIPDKDERKKVKLKLETMAYLSAGLCAIGMVFLIISQFYNIFYSFDEFNRYYRLQPAFLQQLLPIIAITMMFCFSLPYFKRLDTADRVCIDIMATVLVALLVFTAFRYGFDIGGIGAEAAGIMMFAGYVFSNAHKSRRNEKTIALKDAAIEEQKVRIMQNQIRPHFIFNSLLAIKQLCHEDPRAAADALQHFSNFLRANLDAMSEDVPVPISREIDCIREYVALEQADPASRFTVNYDIGFEDFCVPLLSVEPMVENAIRHGLATKRGDGLVTIKTAREGDNAVVTVEDNGSGFGSETSQQARHRSIGIQNSRDRLSIQCNGELSIITTGNGTIVRIVIPITDEKDEAGV